MLVNIIVRTFRGREKLLVRALESIKAQETGHDISVIVAVDGQPIDTDGIDLSQFGDVSTVSARAPGGRSAAANAGLDAAGGDLIGFLDDDDWFEPDHVETLTRLFDDNLGAAAAYAGAWEQEADLNVQDPAASVLGERKVFFRRTRNSLDLVNRNLFPIQAILFRRSALESSGARFSTELDALEDWLFWQQLLLGELIVSTDHVTSTFLMPLDKEVRRRRADAHREALPAMLALRRQIRVPVAVADELIRTRYRAPAGGAKAEPGSVRGFLSARIDRLARKRPKLRHKLEYFVLRALRKLWRLTPKGRAEVARMRKRRDRKKQNRAAISVVPSLPALQQRFEPTGAPQPRTSGTAVFTSCNWAYMDKALVLAESVARYMPEAEFHILLVDTPRPEMVLPPSVTRLYPSANLKDFRPGWVFKHTVVELSTAVKPLYTDVLLDEGYSRIIYFDPDTMLLSEPVSIDQDLKRGDFLLTPHLHRPAVSRVATETFEISAMAHGIYNLGFFALNNTAAAREVVSYWAERCRGYSYGEVHRGVFTDQKWANHFPVFFEEAIVVSSNPGLNTAVWNAEGRAIVRRNETFLIDGVPIEMFHFSGWDSGVPDRFSLEFLGSGSGSELVTLYTEANQRFLQFKDRFWPYAFYDDGTRIETPHRLLYRRDGSFQEAHPNPYVSGPGTFQDYADSNREAIFARHDESKLLRRHF